MALEEWLCKVKNVSDVSGMICCMQVKESSLESPFIGQIKIKIFLLILILDTSQNAKKNILI